MKIVSLVPSATEIVAALGLGDDLVGVTHSCDYPPGLRARRVTSTCVPAGAPSREIDAVVKESVRAGRPLYHLDARLVEALNPDLVVTQSICDVCAVGEEQATAGLEGLSIRPQVVALHPHRLEDVLDDILRVGGAADVGERARLLVDGLRSRISRVGGRVRSRTPARVAVLEWIDPLFSAGHWTPEIVALAGGLEVLARPGERSRELRWNEVRAADPDVLVLACCGMGTSRTLEDVRYLESLPDFGGLRAVRNRLVFVADGGSHFSRPGPRLVESLELLAETLHPSGELKSRGLAPVYPLSRSPISSGGWARRNPLPTKASDT